jgi:hypothetical protein
MFRVDGLLRTFVFLGLLGAHGLAAALAREAGLGGLVVAHASMALTVWGLWTTEGQGR